MAVGRQVKSDGDVAQYRLRVVGRNVASFLEAADRHGVSSLIDMSSTVPRVEALALQKSADVLLMFLWAGKEEGIYTTKFFEYVGAERPIMAIGASNSDVGQWIRSADLGKVATTVGDVADQLATWHDLKLSGQGRQLALGSRYEFTRGKQFAALVDHLQSLIK